MSARYRRRRPERTTLHRIVRENLNTFFAESAGRSADGRCLPKYVRGAFQRYLGCGLLQNGFVWSKSPGGGHAAAVAFSCKERGVCPSWAGRRMADVSPHLHRRGLPGNPT